MLSIYNNVAYHYMNTVMKIEYLTHIMIYTDYASNIDIRSIKIKRWSLNNELCTYYTLTAHMQ